MPVVEESILIARRPEEVFDYLCKPDNVPLWDGSVVQAEQIGTDPVGVGTRWRGTSKIMGRRFEWTTEVTEFDLPRRMSSTAVEGKLTFSVTYELAPAAGGGTRYTYRVDAESGLGGLFGRFADPIVQRVQSLTVRANLGKLAELLGGPAQPVGRG